MKRLGEQQYHALDLVEVMEDHQMVAWYWVQGVDS